MRSFYIVAVSHEGASIKWLVPERARELDTTEGVRDFATVSLSPAMPKPVPVMRVATSMLPPELEFAEAVPSDAKERQRWD